MHAFQNSSIAHPSISMQSELSTLKGLQQEWEVREQGLKRQLAARMKQLETFEHAPVVAPPRAVTRSLDRSALEAELASTMASKVKDAVAAERARWKNVEAAVGDVISERKATSHFEQLIRDAERDRDNALADAAKLRSALRQVEGDLQAFRKEAARARDHAMQSKSACGGRGSIGAISPPDSPQQRQKSAAISSGGAMGSSGLAHAANAAAVERWEAEKRLQKRLEVSEMELSRSIAIDFHWVTDTRCALKSRLQPFGRWRGRNSLIRHGNWPLQRLSWPRHAPNWKKQQGARCSAQNSACDSLPSPSLRALQK